MFEFTERRWSSSALTYVALGGLTIYVILFIYSCNNTAANSSGGSGGGGGYYGGYYGGYRGGSAPAGASSFSGDGTSHSSTSRGGFGSSGHSAIS